VVGAFLIGCAVLLLVGGCAGVRSEAPQEEEQAHTEATASEESRCEGTRTFKPKGTSYLRTTNDLPGCPNGGLLSGTDKADILDGMDGDDEIHGLGGSDYIDGGGGNDAIYGGPGGGDESLSGDDGDDVIYGGAGNDFWLLGRAGEDVLYGSKGNDGLDGTTGESEDGQRDQLFCGPGKDEYTADKLDYVDSSCEKKVYVICCGA
jgi:hypothetical protein